MARDAKDNTKGFYRYMCVGWKAKDSVLPLINKMGELVTADGGKLSISPSLHPSVFAGNHSPYNSQSLVPKR